MCVCDDETWLTMARLPRNILAACFFLLPLHPSLGTLVLTSVLLTFHLLLTVRSCVALCLSRAGRDSMGPADVRVGWGGPIFASGWEDNGPFCR